MLSEVKEPITQKLPNVKNTNKNHYWKSNTHHNKTKWISVFMKYQYVTINGPEEKLYNITTTDRTRIKHMKLDKSFIYRDLEYNQYEIDKGTQQYVRSEQGQDHYTYIYTYI